MAGDPTLPQPLRTGGAASSVASTTQEPSASPLECLAPAWARSPRPRCPLLVLRVRDAPEINIQLALEELDQAGEVHKVRRKTRSGVALVTQVDEGREGLEGLVLGRRITRSLGALGLLPETRHGGADAKEGAKGS